MDGKVCVLDLVGTGEAEFDVGELGGQGDDSEFGGLQRTANGEVSFP